MLKITAKQQQILDFITTCLQTNGAPPTRTELCLHFGFRSPTAADDHLKALSRKGLIELIPSVSRGIRVLQKQMVSGLPLVGQVAAGAPILAQEHIEEVVELDAQQFKPKADYLLRVRGHSIGNFQGSCTFSYAANNTSFCGFSATAPQGRQFRVWPDHRLGFAALAS